jgi:hypothetical protein
MTTIEKLKTAASELSFQPGSRYRVIQLLIARGFFDTPKSTGQLLLEIRQSTGNRWKSNVVQTYMRKFMEAGIIRSIRDKDQRGNLWVIAVTDSPETVTFKFKPSARKCTVLVLAANPLGTNQLALDEEVREIEQKVRASANGAAFDIFSKWAVRPGDLLQYLNQHRADVVHFCGHGSCNQNLILSDDDGRPKPVNPAALKKLFSTLKDNIRIVVLNACFSQAQAEAITEVIDCAVGMTEGIGDRAAIKFAAAFYQALGFGRSVKIAFDSGIAALMLHGIPEEQTPILLVRKGVDPTKLYMT